jgi:hypothetical protein
MPQVSTYVNAPYQGVSQAPPQARRGDQADILEDCLVTIPEGWTTRPPWNWTGKLADHPGHTNGLFERIQRAGKRDAIFTLTNEGGVVRPRLYLTENFPGVLNSETITISADAQAYLNAGNPSPQADFAIQTVEDFTFIVNRKVSVGNSTSKAAARPFEAMVWVKQANYARTYTVTVSPAGGSPVTASLTTPNGATATDANFVDTGAITTALFSGGAYTASNGASHSGQLDSLTSQGFTVLQFGPVIYISHPTIDFALVATDGSGNSSLAPIKGAVQTFSDLPKTGVDGFTVRIVQQAGTANDDFFVKYVATAGQLTGVWQETIGPGADLGLDPRTMPVTLVDDGGWKVNLGAWKGRTTGDASLVPDPDFIGQPIQDLGFWRNRLALLAGEGVTLSSAEDPLRFYPRTLAAVIDSDPISLLSPTASRSTFRYFVEFDTKLLAFGDISQAQVVAEGVVKPSSTKIELLTKYPFAPVGNTFRQPSRPQDSNGRVYFLASRSKDWATVYELKVDNVINVTGANDLGTAFPRYVPAGVDRVANCPLNFIIAYGVSGQQSLVLHCFRYAEQERLQNAPLTWHMPINYVLAGAFCRNTEIVCLTSYGGEAHVVTADTAINLLDDGSTRLLTSLDLRADETQVFNRTYHPTTGNTSFDLPFRLTAQPVCSVRGAAGGVGGVRIVGQPLGILPEGYELPFAGYLADGLDGHSNSYVELKGDYTQTPFYVGTPYKSRWRLSRLYAEPTANAPIHSGRLSIRRIRSDVSASGYIRAEVTASGRPMRTYTFSGFELSDPESLLNVTPSKGGEFSFPVMSRNDRVTIEFVNDSHLQASVQGFEWTGELNTKSQRIGG